MKMIDTFIDGSCIKNPGPGGYGILIKYNNYTKEISNGYYLTTNNRMELMGALILLKNINKKYILKINTDSMYLKLGITKWIYNWKNNNWKLYNKKEIKNLDLWKLLYFNICKFKIINWNWIKSHSGVKENERCDFLAKLSSYNPKLKDYGYEKQNYDKYKRINYK
ncbi:ribonuclease H [endosymbiont of Sipalinus gigas]|uniref:ribonuclease HI n=1 Tax=endosymbiont of Sipalinus gigas TaxID=1972134 RepID=UPI000DC7148C|nr:ribonuclease HI [endosymbiont of Sipalinus gigas]BBA85361.1 ribonuclease H [endosymbiont of Sipalinus gigas]